jgi:hypothetical protein
MLLLLYLDDLILTSVEPLIIQCKKELSTKFDMKDCWTRDMIDFMMLIRSFLTDIICIFYYFEEVLKDSCIQSP